MEVRIALAGNPNSGKTTMFNDLTGSNQRVGNWPGVTVEKKEGRLKGGKDVVIQDLPGIYSLSPYTLEEVVARNYLVGEKPDAIINIVDGTNIERNLYLTTQLLELGIPTVVAVNMIDVVRKNGDAIDIKKLASALGCEVVVTSALKGEGSAAAAERAAGLAKAHRPANVPSVFTGSVEHAIAHIEESIEGKVDKRFLRWYAIKLFERDEKVLEELKLDAGLWKHIDEHIADCEREMEDDSESIITNQRYAYIARVVGSAVKKKSPGRKLTLSDKIDRVVTNRFAALPLFVAIMAIVYWVAMGPKIGTPITDWTNDVLVGEWCMETVRGWMEGASVAPLAHRPRRGRHNRPASARSSASCRRCLSSSSCSPSSRTSAIWPVSPSSWTASSASSASPARVSSPCSLAPAAASPPSWRAARLRTSATGA